MHIKASGTQRSQGLKERDRIRVTSLKREKALKNSGDRAWLKRSYNISSLRSFFTNIWAIEALSMFHSRPKDYALILRLGQKSQTGGNKI